MAHDMMTINDNPNISGWTLDDGYKGKLQKIEYPIRLFNSGHLVALALFLNLSEDDLEYVCQLTGLGFKVILSMPGETVETSGTSFQVPLFESTRIVIRPTYTITSDSLSNYLPIDRRCFYNSERKLRFFKIYTEGNCETECLSNFTKHECGCVRIAMPSNI